jgi:tetratricopeptide (TPR) repeat protein
MHTEDELLKIAMGLLDTNKYKKSIEFFTQAIEKNPLNAMSYGNRAIAWFKILDIESALGDVQKAIELDSQYHEAWFMKGEILRQRKEFREAEDCYKHADKLYPDSLYYLTGLMQTASSQKKYGDTIAYCNRILEESPADDLALYYRGLAFSSMKNYPAAIKDYLKLLEIGKRTSGIYNNLGFWYSKIGDLKKAGNNLNIALQINPTHPYALDNLGYVQYLKGEFKKGLELINQALGVDPSNSYGYKNRALIYLKTGEREQAMEDLKKARVLGYTEDYDKEVDDLLKSEFNI